MDTHSTFKLATASSGQDALRDVDKWWIKDQEGRISTLEATKETDMLLYEEYTAKGYAASQDGKTLKDCPGDSNSLIGRWWQEGFNKSEAEKYRRMIDVSNTK